jgi:hypothetical protein
MIAYKCDRCFTDVDSRNSDRLDDKAGDPMALELPVWWQKRDQADRSARSWTKLHLCQPCADLIRDLLGHNSSERTSNGR